MVKIFIFGMLALVFCALVDQSLGASGSSGDNRGNPILSGNQGSVEGNRLATSLDISDSEISPYLSLLFLAFSVLTFAFYLLYDSGHYRQEMHKDGEVGSRAGVGMTIGFAGPSVILFLWFSWVYRQNSSVFNAFHVEPSTFLLRFFEILMSYPEKFFMGCLVASLLPALMATYFFATVALVSKSSDENGRSETGRKSAIGMLTSLTTFVASIAQVILFFQAQAK